MEIVIRSLLLYVFVWLLLRALGRRELAEMSSFDLVLLIVMGDLIQQGVTQEDMSVTGAMLSVSTLTLVTFASSYVAFRSRRARPALAGIAVVVIRDGQVQEEAIRLERLTLEDVKEAARLQGVSDIAHIRLGVLEADGKFSFLLTDPPRQESADEGGERQQPGTESA